jgi:hypothetical protein
MSDAPKKRRWFQYHLSTAVVVMFVASAFLLANLTPRRYGSQPDDIGYGWPAVLTERSMHDDPFGPADLFPWWWYAVFAIDVLMPIVSMMFAAITTEWLIQRKERRR